DVAQEAAHDLGRAGLGQVGPYILHLRPAQTRPYLLHLRPAERVLGRSEVKYIRSGLAIGLILSATCCRSSSTSPGPLSTPDLGVTKATMPCPFSSCDTPTTAASATEGWLTSALSSSI